MYHNLINKIDTKNSEISIRKNNEENIEQLLFNILNFIYEIKINNHNEIFKEYLNLLSNIFDKEKDHNINNLTFQSIINNNVLDYEKNYNYLLFLHKEKKDVDVLSNHLKLLKKAMPNQYFNYCNSFNDPVWSERFKFFSKAWYFSNAKLWIERLTDPDAYDLLEKNHKDIIEHKFNIIDKLASKKSWANFFGPNGIQPQQMESLKAWAKLITALGKGKGKHAARKTKAAKDKMKEMQESILVG